MKWFLLLTVFLSNMGFAQNIKKHQWKNRVLVISASAKDTFKVERQMTYFESVSKQLLERKLVLYECVENTCTFYNYKEAPQTISAKNNPATFSIALYGLDGGKKFESDVVVTPNVLFSLIDRMPMRRQEIREKDN
jgi:hypothetical protein